MAALATIVALAPSYPPRVGSFNRMAVIGGMVAAAIVEQ
jgi:hypothetical protein